MARTGAAGWGPARLPEARRPTSGSAGRDSPGYQLQMVSLAWAREGSGIPQDTGHGASINK